MKVLVASKNPGKLKAVRNAFSKYFDNVEVVGEKVSSGVSDTPLTEEETFKGLRNRMDGLKEREDVEFKIAIESGTYGFSHRRYLFTWVLVQKEKQRSFGKSIMYPLPKKVSNRIEKGEDLSNVSEEVSAIDDVRSKDGIVGFLSKGSITRPALTEDAIISALFPFINEEIYR